MAGALSFSFERRFEGGTVVAAAAELPLDTAPVTVLFGPSGGGKTTILRTLAGLERPQSGFVRFRGETWSDVERGVFVAPQRRGVGIVFQDYALFPHLTVAENIAFGVSTERAARERKVRELADLLAIPDLLQRRPAALSGGQRQRVALARALATGPRLLLLDEPLSALEQTLREELRVELRRLLLESRVPAVVVTHDRDEALALGDQIAVVAAGNIRQLGPVDRVLGAPDDAEIARLVGTENVLPGRVVGRDGGLARVDIAGKTLVAVDLPGLPDDVFACVRAEEIALETEGGAPTSARNRLPATVVATAPLGPLVRVRLDCGFPLVALVTRSSVEELGLRQGARVLALLKVPAIRLVPHRR
jgi:molybdate transport system ATP-binding protein